MSEQQRRLIDRARARYGAIAPCSGKTEWSGCFTTDRGLVIFWFNSTDNSTHIEAERTK